MSHVSQTANLTRHWWYNLPKRKWNVFLKIWYFLSLRCFWRCLTIPITVSVGSTLKNQTYFVYILSGLSIFHFATIPVWTCHILKGTVHPQNPKFTFFLFPAGLFAHLDCFSVSCRVLEIVMSAFSQMKWNKVALGFGCSKLQKMHLRNSTVMPLSRNHDLVTQDKPLLVVSSFM